jgi:hypothetical protein
MSNISLPGDSGDYHLLTKGIELSANVPGMTCEIGLRRGGGTKTIIDALAQYAPHKVHIAIDPYGNIEYEHKEGDIVRLDYTNEMRDECLGNLYPYAKEKKINFQFFNLEDREFFKRYGDGVPVYDYKKRVEKDYSFVHFDGPHALEPLDEEISFFRYRTPVGGVWCFDDITGYYDHSRIEERLTLLGFVVIEKRWHKGLYKRAAVI